MLGRETGLSEWYCGIDSVSHRKHAALWVATSETIIIQLAAKLSIQEEQINKF